MRLGGDDSHLDSSRLGSREDRMSSQLSSTRRHTDQSLRLRDTLRAGPQHIEMLPINVFTPSSKQHTSESRDHDHRRRSPDMDAWSVDGHRIRVRDATTLGDLDGKMHTHGDFRHTTQTQTLTTPGPFLDRRNHHRHNHRPNPPHSLNAHDLAQTPHAPPKNHRHSNPLSPHFVRLFLSIPTPTNTPRLIITSALRLTYLTPFFSPTDPTLTSSPYTLLTQFQSTLSILLACALVLRPLTLLSKPPHHRHAKHWSGSTIGTPYEAYQPADPFSSRTCIIRQAPASLHEGSEDYILPERVRVPPRRPAPPCERDRPDLSMFRTTTVLRECRSMPSAGTGRLAQTGSVTS